MHVRFRSLKNGPVVRNRLRLPHPVKTDLRICVIAAPDSKAAEEARKAGAVLVGEDEIFSQVKEGTIEFDRCICHSESLQKLNKAGLGRILGPRGLMPSTKTGTVVTQVGTAVQNMVGGSEYRERMGVVRMAVGQLGFTPEELQTNIKAFMEAVKKDMAQMSDRITKEIHEVVSYATATELVTSNVGIGLKFNECTRLHTKRRIQRRQFHSPKGALGSSVIFSCRLYQPMYHTLQRHRYAKQPFAKLTELSAT